MVSWLETGQFWLQHILNDIWPAKSTFTEYPDLSGQVWIVTGATSGIGLETATKLAQQNAKVWLVGRNEEKLNSVLATIRAKVPNASLEYFVANFADLATIPMGASVFLNAETKLNGIIHNVGVVEAVQPTTSQGTEYIIGVNDVGPHLLQKLLDPVIEATPESRIVWVASAAHAFTPSGGGFDTLDATDQSSFNRYAVSKAVTIVQAVQWTEHHPKATTTKSISVHPGTIRTSLGRDWPEWKQYILEKILWAVEYGTRAPLFAALAPDIPNNAYVVPWGHLGQVRHDVQTAVHGSAGERTWEWLESKVKPYIN